MKKIFYFLLTMLPVITLNACGQKTGSPAKEPHGVEAQKFNDSIKDLETVYNRWNNLCAYIARQTDEMVGAFAIYSSASKNTDQKLMTRFIELRASLTKATGLGEDPDSANVSLTCVTRDSMKTVFAALQKNIETNSDLKKNEQLMAVISRIKNREAEIDTEKERYNKACKACKRNDLLYGVSN